jgi:hypothetical protein
MRSPSDCESALSMRKLLSSAQVTPAVFRDSLTKVPPSERDEWLDLVLGLDGVPEDGPDLPRGCVPYIPCPVDALLRVVQYAEVRPSDVFVDVGAGAGRAATLVRLLTGAASIGLEIQHALVEASRDLTARLGLSHSATIEGDAAVLTGSMMVGSVFFFYCPFSGERLEKVLADLEVIARSRPIRVCGVDVPLPPRSWLNRVSPESDPVAVYRSNLVDMAT